VSVPPRVERVLRSCLQKKATQRLDSAQAVRLALVGAFETTAPAAPSPDAGRPAARRTLMLAGGAVAATLLVTGLVGWTLWPAPAPAHRDDALRHTSSHIRTVLIIGAARTPRRHEA
jgi:hypothetical protein